MVIKNILVYQNFTANQPSFNFNISNVSSYSNKYKTISVKNVSYNENSNLHVMYILRCVELGEDLFTFFPRENSTSNNYTFDISTKLLGNSLTFEIFEITPGAERQQPTGLTDTAYLSFQLEFNTE